MTTTFNVNRVRQKVTETKETYATSWLGPHHTRNQSPFSGMVRHGVGYANSERNTPRTCNEFNRLKSLIRKQNREAAGNFEQERVNHWHCVCGGGCKQSDHPGVPIMTSADIIRSLSGISNSNGNKQRLKRNKKKHKKQTQLFIDWMDSWMSYTQELEQEDGLYLDWLREHSKYTHDTFKVYKGYNFRCFSVATIAVKCGLMTLYTEYRVNNKIVNDLQCCCRFCDTADYLNSATIRSLVSAINKSGQIILTQPTLKKRRFTI